MGLTMKLEIIAMIVHFTLVTTEVNILGWSGIGKRGTSYEICSIIVDYNGMVIKFNDSRAHYRR